MKPAEEMTPAEIIATRDTSGYAFIPVSPTFEWHGPHLPLGTDALISEGICHKVAEAVKGIFFRPLAFGLDQFRSQNELDHWGLNEKDSIFGMNFPTLPLNSEYCEKTEMLASLNNRLQAIRNSGFKAAFIVNNHGGHGQHQTLEQFSQQSNSPAFRVEYVKSSRFCTLHDHRLEVGGHAGLSETHWLLAFRPELIDIKLLPEGELSVAKTGILHVKPQIEEKYNPHHVSKELAEQLAHNVIENFVAYLLK